ncbi:MAG: hypothetical protein ACRD03_01535 [Acidimicrobiales bacterium]
MASMVGAAAAARRSAGRTPPGIEAGGLVVAQGAVLHIGCGHPDGLPAHRRRRARRWAASAIGRAGMTTPQRVESHLHLPGIPAPNKARSRQADGAGAGDVVHHGA